MRILDESSDKSLNRIILYLTLSEAMELRDGLDDLIKNPSNNHTHVSSEDFNKETTVCVYDVNDLNLFNKRSIDLILNDN